MSIRRHERARLAALERRVYALEHDHLAHRIEHLWDLFDELGMPLPRSTATRRRELGQLRTCSG